MQNIQVFSKRLYLLLIFKKYSVENLLKYCIQICQHALKSKPKL